MAFFGLINTKRLPDRVMSEVSQKMDAVIAAQLQNIFSPKWSESIRYASAQYLELYHTSPRMEPIHKIAKSLASSTFKVYRKADLRANGVERATAIGDHPVFDFMENPIPDHPEIDGAMLRYLIQVYVELNGECFLLIVKDLAGRPREAYPVPSNWVIATPTVAQPWFRIMPLGNTAYQQINVDPRDVVWFKEPNVVNPYGRGRGRAEVVGDELQIDESAAKYSKNFFANDARAPGFITLPGSSQQSVDIFKDAWNRAHQGIMNSYKMGFTGADAKFVSTGTSQKDIEFIETRKYTRDEVNHMYGIPPELFGILEHSNRATIESAYYLYSKEVLTPRALQWDTWINRQLMPMWDKEFVIKSDNLVAEDATFNVTKAQAGYSGGFMKKSEARQLLDLPWDPKVDQDSYFEPRLGTVPITGPEAGGGVHIPDSVDDDSPIADLTGNREPMTGDEAPDTTIPATQGDPNLPFNMSQNLPPNMSQNLPDKPLKGVRRKILTPDIKKAFWRKIDKAATGNEPEFIDAAHKVSKQQFASFQATFAKNLEAMSQTESYEAALATTFGPETDLATQRAFSRAWAKSMADGYVNADTLLGSPVPMNHVRDAFAGWIESEGLKKAVTINATTEDAIRASLTQGIQGGEGVTSLMDRISKIQGDLAGYRAENIARTETIGSMNFGALTTYKAAGVAKKEWLTEIDDRTRQEHADADGQTVDVDEDFSVGGENLPAPGLGNEAANNCGCRCTVLPVIKRDEGPDE